jgi:LPXTG-motif cell wall-anchored protein
MPPPTPFKLFVLLAGIAEIRPLTFVAAVGLGRGFRYGGEAFLTYRYGERATEFISNNLPAVSMALAGLIVAGGVGLVLWRRRRQPA